jgi:hypothetical protein
MNILPIFLAALIPLVVGSIWYNPRVIGKAWMDASGMTEEKMRTGNIVPVIVLTYVFGVLASFALYYMVVHQAHIYSMVANEPGFGDPNSEIGQWLAGVMERYGDNYRTFKHGALHGAINGIAFATPVIAIVAMFERRSTKYILIHAAYWTITLTLMGGLVCSWQ